MPGKETGLKKVEANRKAENAKTLNWLAKGGSKSAKQAITIKGGKK